jgi:hypothetical protein
MNDIALILALIFGFGGWLNTLKLHKAINVLRKELNESNARIHSARRLR